MAAPYIYENGIGGSTGSILATAPRLVMSGAVWYVDSTTGTDAASPAGQDRVKPLATLAQAYTNASAGDIIVFLAGHTEIITSNVTLAKAGLALIGEGTTTTMPKFTWNGVGGVPYTLSAINCYVDNLWFAASSQSPGSSGRVRVTGAGNIFVGCKFDSGANDDYAALAIEAANISISGATFTNTSTTTQPLTPIIVSAAANGLWIDNSTIDGGTIGWSGRLGLNVNTGSTSVKITRLNLLRDSDVTLVTACTGWIATKTLSGSTRLYWTA
jgi:hypothetical protein